MSLHRFCNSVHLGLGLEQTASHSDCVCTSFSLSHNRETLPTTQRPCRQPKTWAAEESGGEGLYAGDRNRRGGWPTTHQSVREPGTLFFFPWPPSIREEMPSSQGNSVVNGGGGDDDWRGNLERDCGSPREGFLISSPSPWGKSSISESYEFSGFWRFVEHAILSSILHLFCSIALGEK